MVIYNLRLHRFPAILCDIFLGETYPPESELKVGFRCLGNMHRANKVTNKGVWSMNILILKIHS